jgi:hypothetical protein
MAYSFNGTNQYLSQAVVPVSAAPLTIACLSDPASASNGTLIAIDKISAQQVLQIANNLLPDRINALAAAGATIGQTEVNSSLNAQAAAGVFDSTTSRVAYFNATASAVNTTSVSPTGMDNVNIGTRWYSTLAGYFPGLISEAAIWNVALTQAEITSLSKGFKPTRIRPQNLVFYAPLVRGLQNLKGGVLTNNNTATVANHPRVY